MFNPFPFESSSANQQFGASPLGGSTVVGAPYPIYTPIPVGTPLEGGMLVPAQPGAAASETIQSGGVVAPAPPRVDYRSVPGGAANTDLDDPFFRSAITR
jgi:hypothetical protein